MSSSHLALARKWRPQRFEDVIGQRGVVDTLKNAITTGRLAQSFIFAGPRGVGKTTTARILARALNCVKGPTGEPCGTCDACVEIAEGRDMDVLEIDAATHTQVDHVREVIVEPLSIAPMRDRFKVFIIDEVHRLSKNAFDALLKSVEEPPPYVKFMMATTELHAVPVTIQSRSQVFELRALPFTSIRDQLRAITAREKVTIDDAAVALVARSAEGSMRDALSSLDQVLAFKNDDITAGDVSTVLGLIGRDQQFEIAEIVAREDLAGAFAVAGAVIEAGFDPRIVCRELARLMRDLLVVRIDPTRTTDPEIAAEGEAERLKALAASYSREDLMRAFDLLSRAEFEIRTSSQPRHQFEMALVKWIHLRQLTPLSDLIMGAGNRDIGKSGNREIGESGNRPIGGSSRPSVPGKADLKDPNGPGGPKADPKDSKDPQDPKDRVGPGVGPGPSASSDFKSQFLSSIRDQHKTFHSMVIAQAQKVEVEADTVVFTFAPVHKSMRAQLEGRKAALEQLAASVAGRKITIVTRESAPAPAVAASDDHGAARRADLAARAKAEPAVQAVLDVFGGEIEDVEEIDK